MYIGMYVHCSRVRMYVCISYADGYGNIYIVFEYIL